MTGFVDEVFMHLKAGDGGDGSRAFRREANVPFGGPSGGDGGRGGSIILLAEEGRSSLVDLAHLPVQKAERGDHGRGSDMYGKAGEDFILRVPIGTQVFDAESGELIADLESHHQRVIICHGGRGGRGNKHFATPFDRAPTRSEPGTPGEEKRVRLELKVMADVGLVGFPNVGKSTLVSAMSRARPRIADYPFTTLRPHLGVVQIGSRSSTAHFVLADIPGLIPGASEGLGLGIRFLKHVERCRALLHLVSPQSDPLRDDDPSRSPLADYDALIAELKAFAPDLAKRPSIVAMSKSDIPEARDTFPEVQKAFAKRGIALRLISAATGDGMANLARDLFVLVQGHVPQLEDGEATADEVAVAQKESKAATKTPEKPVAAKKPAAAVAKKAAAKKPAAPVAKKAATPVAKKAATKKPAAPVAKKAATKKPAAPVAKKAAAKKPAAKKPAAKKAVAKKKSR